MTFLLKDPDAVLDYAVDWGAEYLAEDLLAQSSWHVDPAEPGGLEIAGSDFDTAVATVKAAAGLPGNVYRLINKVATQQGRIDERSITIRVENR